MGTEDDLHHEALVVNGEPVNATLKHVDDALDRQDGDTAACATPDAFAKALNNIATSQQESVAMTHRGECVPGVASEPT